MKQHEVVIETLASLGGASDISSLTEKVLSNKSFTYSGKTPAANIRRILQERPEIYRIEPGLWGLLDMKKQNDEKGLLIEEARRELTPSLHAYYQGLSLKLGKLKGYETYSPNQDKSQKFTDGEPLGNIRTLASLPDYSYKSVVSRSETIDASWYANYRLGLLPACFFEIEHSTDIQNSLLKFVDLQAFSVHMYIVAHKSREVEFNRKLEYEAFLPLKHRVKFLSYDEMAKRYEYARDIGVEL